MTEPRVVSRASTGPGHPRLHPPLTSSRYLVLTGLRRALLSLVASHVEGSRPALALDVGAGSSPYRSLIEPLVGAYRTVDLPGRAADLEVDGQGRVPVPDGEVDLVLSNQVLEHVEDPAGHLAELARVARPGGLLILSTHGYWMYHPDPGDYWRWTGPGLRKTLRRAGFETLETRGVLGRAAAGVQLVQDGLLSRVPARLRFLVAPVFQVCAALADRLDSSDRADDACVFVIVARRMGQGA